mmetsp:Transcript_35557/g.94598  ORF Transcript_35557/g.94598 Transcript_35557/m.94598 type:complete len:295 (+) Transcript_35557:409-1293(+)
MVRTGRDGHQVYPREAHHPSRLEVPEHVLDPAGQALPRRLRHREGARQHVCLHANGHWHALLFEPRDLQGEAVHVQQRHLGPGRGAARDGHPAIALRCRKSSRPGHEDHAHAHTVDRSALARAAAALRGHVAQGQREEAEHLHDPSAARCAGRNSAHVAGGAGGVAWRAPDASETKQFCIPRATRIAPCRSYPSGMGGCGGSWCSEEAGQFWNCRCCTSTGASETAEVRIPSRASDACFNSFSCGGCSGVFQFQRTRRHPSCRCCSSTRSSETSAVWITSCASLASFCRGGRSG